MDDEVVASFVVFRHGARGLSANAFRSLRADEPAAAAVPAVDQWAHKLDDLSATGELQMHVLGEWLLGQYLSGRAGDEMRSSLLTEAGSVRWHSSPVDRVVRSGHAFLRGCRAASRAPVGPELPLPSAQDAVHDADGGAGDASDAAFRPWVHNEPYRAAADEWRRGPALSGKALATSGETRRLHRAALARAAEEAPSPSVQRGAAAEEDPSREDGSEDHKRSGELSPASRRLYRTTYLLEVLECERHWCPRDDEAGGGAVASEGPGAAASSSAPLRLGARGIRPVLTASLPPSRRRRVEELARFVWGGRFFSRPARRLGRPLLRLAVATLAAHADAAGAAAAAAPPRLTVCSAHDYTILALLSALRVSAYPGRVMSFGAFVVLELRRSRGAPGRAPAFTVDVLLNAEPFPHASTSRLSSRPLRLCSGGTRALVSDVPLESLAFLAEAASAPRRA